MKVCIRILAALTLLLASVVLLLSLAGGVGVWIVKGPLTERATRIFERIEAALDIADHGLEHVKTTLARAAERLNSAKEEQQRLAREPQQNSVLRRLLARTVQQSLAPELGNAHESLHTVAEAAVVVNSVLEDVGSFPFLSTAGLDLSRLTEINSRLAEVGPAAWELSRLLGEPATGSDADAASTQVSRIERTLQTLQGLIDEYEPRLTQVRQRTEELKARTLPWIAPAVVIVSLVCLWIALSQVSLLCHAWSWWRQVGRNNSRPG
jgi:hypothetical protein